MLFVFSTQLANQAVEAVKCGRFPNVITFHQSLDETKRHLSRHASAALKYSPGKINVGRSLSSYSGSNGGPVGECSSIPSPRTSTSSEPNDTHSSSKFSFKLENTQQCSSSSSKSVDDKKSIEPICRSSSAGGIPNSSDNVYSPGADAGNLPLTDVPFSNSGGDPLEKMARLTQETLPFEPPLKQPRLGSPREKPKIPDDQLTPAARQHRQEALQKIEGLKQVFGLSPVQQTHMFLPGQPPTVMGMPPPDGIKLEQISCSSASSSAEAQLKWRQQVEEHEMQKKIGSGMNKIDSVGPAPTMMVQGKPAVMVHPVTAPRHFNPRGGRTPGPRMMPPMPQNSDGYFQPNCPPGGPNFDPNFCGNFEFVPQQQPRCFVIQQSRMPNGMGGPPGPSMFIPRSMPPQGTSMNVNMNIHVNPPDNGGMPQPCYQEFMGPFDDEDPYFDGGYPPGMCGNMPPMSSNTYFCGPNGVVFEDGGAGNGMGGPPRGNGVPPNFTMESYPNKGQQQQMSTGGGPQPMVNNTFVNATMSIQQVNIQNVSPFPSGNIVRVQSMQPSHPGPSMSWGPGGCPPQQQPHPQQQFGRRPASYSPMQMAPLRTFGPETTRFLLQDFAEPLRNLDSKVPSQKLQYFPNSSQPRPYDAQSAPNSAPPQLAHQPPPSDSRDVVAAPNAVASFAPTNDGRQGDVNYDAQFQNFQQQLYSINPRRSDSLPN